MLCALKRRNISETFVEAKQREELELEIPDEFILLRLFKFPFLFCFSLSLPQNPYSQRRTRRSSPICLLSAVHPYKSPSAPTISISVMLVTPPGPSVVISLILRF